MVIPTISRNTETIVSQGKPTILGVKSCKSFRKALQTLIGQNAKKGYTELEFYTRGILELYNKFHPERVTEIEVESWKGKSSIEIIKQLDKLIIIKYQKPSKDEEPIKVRTEISQEELEAMIFAIKNSTEEYTPTKKLALDYCIKMGYDEMLEGNLWKNFFSNRQLHNRFTLMLDALREEGLIEYKHGKTKLLNKDISIQLIL